MAGDDPSRFDMNDADTKAARVLFERLSDGVLLLDSERRILAVNPAFVRMTGHPRDSVLGRELRAVGLIDDDSHASSLMAREKRLYCRDHEGRRIPVLVQTCRAGDGGYTLMRFVRLDEQANALSRLATTDFLTGLPNRAHFMERLSHALARARRTGERLGLLFIDLDHFKRINDTLGHLTGDRFLEAVALRLAAQVRDSDTLARYGGDEFCLLLESLARPEDAVQVAEKILKVLEKPVGAGDYALNVGASIGIAITDGEQETPDALIVRADRAMYRAKSRGGGRFHLLDSDLEGVTSVDHAVEESLSLAFEREEFDLRFMPFVWIEQREVLAMAEVRPRWRLGRERVFQGAALDAVLRETGMQDRFDHWLIDRLCELWQRWHAQGLGVPLMAIRMGGHHLFCAPGKSMLERLVDGAAGCRCRLLVQVPFELLGEKPAFVAPCLQRLRSQEIEVGLTGFGTDCASFAFLEHFVPDTIQLSERLLERLDESPVHAALLHAVCRLGDALGIRLAADVGSLAVAPEVLAEAGCHWIREGDPVSGYGERDFTERLMH